MRYIDLHKVAGPFELHATAIWRPDDPILGALIGTSLYQDADEFPWISDGHREIDFRVNLHFVVISLQLSLTINLRP